MKKTLILVLFVVYHAKAQDKSIGDTLKYSLLNNKEYAKKIKTYQDFIYYEDKDGFVYSKGMTLRLGKPENPNNRSDVIIGQPRVGGFTFIREHKELVVTLDKKFSNEEVIIKGFHSFHVFKRVPLRPTFECQLVRTNESVFIDEIDKAIQLGEVINPMKKPNKTQAIALLEEKKKMLDLGLITKEEYEKIKNEYAEVILK